MHNKWHIALTFLQFGENKKWKYNKLSILSMSKFQKCQSNMPGIMYITSIY